MITQTDLIFACLIVALPLWLLYYVLSDIRNMMEQDRADDQTEDIK